MHPLVELGTTCRVPGQHRQAQFNNLRSFLSQLDLVNFIRIQPFSKFLSDNRYAGIISKFTRVLVVVEKRRFKLVSSFLSIESGDNFLLRTEAISEILSSC